MTIRSKTENGSDIDIAVGVGIALALIFGWLFDAHQTPLERALQAMCGYSGSGEGRVSIIVNTLPDRPVPLIGNHLPFFDKTFSVSSNGVVNLRGASDVAIGKDGSALTTIEKDHAFTIEPGITRGSSVIVSRSCP